MAQLWKEREEWRQKAEANDSAKLNMTHLRKERDDWKRKAEGKGSAGLNVKDLKQVRVGKPTLIFPEFRGNRVYEAEQDQVQRLEVAKWKEV